jgi:hypothetical protein
MQLQPSQAQGHGTKGSKSAAARLQRRQRRCAVAPATRAAASSGTASGAPAQPLAAPRAGSGGACPTRNVQASGLFDGLFRGSGGATAAPAGFSERPLYKPNEMLKIGDLDVSPMGLGTWSWCVGAPAVRACGLALSAQRDAAGASPLASC